MDKPKFKAGPGQVDYTNAHWAPVINCVLRRGDKILIVQRSSGLNLYPEYWNGISGFLDDAKSLEEKVKSELIEEVGIGEKNIEKIVLGEIFDQDEPAYKKTWIVHPVLVEVSTDKIKLDWEAKDYKWIKPEDAASFKLLPGFDMVLEKLRIETGTRKPKKFYAGGFLYNPKTKSVFLHLRDDKTDINPNKWGFFGGRNEGNESPVECFVRELKEELNITFEKEKINYLCNYLNTERNTWRHVFYIESKLDKSAIRLSEGADADWVPLGRVFEYNLTEKTARDLKTFLKSIQQTKQ